MLLNLYLFRWGGEIILYFLFCTSFFLVCISFYLFNCSFLIKLLFKKKKTPHKFLDMFLGKSPKYKQLYKPMFEIFWCWIQGGMAELTVVIILNSLFNDGKIKSLGLFARCQFIYKSIPHLNWKTCFCSGKSINCAVLLFGMVQVVTSC